MRMRSILKSSLFAVAATVIGTSAALATPLFSAPTSFTWNPSGVGLSNAGAFTASNITVNDYSFIDATNPNLVLENGFLSVNNFNTTTPGLHSLSGTIGGATAYGLYFQVTTTSHIAPAGLAPLTLGDFVGKFDTISYTLWGDVGGTCSFSADSLGSHKSCSSTQIVLATGSLDTDPNADNSASIVGNNILAPFNNSTNKGIPAANVDVTVDSINSAFWLDPQNIGNLFFDAAFSNNAGEIQEIGTNKFVVGGCIPSAPGVRPIVLPCPGSGTFTLNVVPEPITLSLFGAGLAGAAALRRRKANKA